MFTGIIEAKSKVVSNTETESVISLVVEKPSGWEVEIGQSIALNGACLTVVEFDAETITFELIAETLKKTSFGNGFPGVVNVERAMLPTDRFEGHIVQGHVDTVGEVVKNANIDGSWNLVISFSNEFDHLVVQKGSITINGVSLTVVDPQPGELTVCLIPHTLEVTTLGELSVGDQLNLEFDIIGKYITKTK